MKPYHRPDDANKRRFNKKLSGLRTVSTENVIGLWKLRFPALKIGLKTRINTSCDIIVATAVLHNLALLWCEPDPLENDQEDNEIENNGPHIQQIANRNQAAIRAAGQVKRDWLTNNYC
jgi:hypothetical protein